MTLAPTVSYDTMSTTSERSESLLTKCCCCIPLRMGCFIFGYLNLLINIFHTFALLSMTLILGIYTHGFEYFDYNTPYEIAQLFPHVDSAEETILKQLAVALVVIICGNIGWLIINSACLIGVHKKSPGPIRLYVGFAIARLLLSLSGFMYLIVTSTVTKHAIVTHGADIGIGGYFIILYYIYAIQLERGKDMPDIPEVISDISFIYPTKLDKRNLDCCGLLFRRRKSHAKKTPQKTV